MAGNSFGDTFRITTFGESHGPASGVVIDGVPGGIVLDLPAIAAQMARRRPGQSALVSARREGDEVEVVSGLFEGRTLGTPLTLLIRNTDADPSSYADFRDTYRPSHADWTTEARYGHRDWRGGGRASARETAARVAAGAVARQLIVPMEVLAWVESVGEISVGVVDPSVEQVESNPVRCPDPEVAAAMERLIRQVRRDGDTIGGVVRGVIRGVPAGLGDPVFDKLEARLAAAMLSIPAAKGFEIGSGYAGSRMRGSAHNDVFEALGPAAEPGRPPPIRTRTNHSGGVQGGISNGMPITFTVAFKPVATIFQEQDTVNRAGEAVRLKPRGRHDPCVVPRAVPIVEAMAALVMADCWVAALGGRKRPI